MFDDSMLEILPMTCEIFLHFSWGTPRYAAQATYLLRLLVFQEPFHRGHAGAAEVAQAAAQGSAHKQAEIYGRYINRSNEYRNTKKNHERWKIIEK